MSILFGDMGVGRHYTTGEGCLYVMPSLAAHYILAHGYSPPAECCAAVLRCPPMRSPEDFGAIAENAPQKYAVLAPDTLVVLTDGGSIFIPRTMWL